jgi:hypothetical protein
MAAIDYLKQQGFTAKVSGSRLIISPASKLTADVRKYVKAHRLELIAEVAANDGQARRLHWTVLASGKAFTMLCTEPITRQQALIDVRARWPDATLQ